MPPAILNTLNRFIEFLYTDYQQVATGIAIVTVIAIPLLMVVYVLMRGQALRRTAETGPGVTWQGLIRLLLNLDTLIAVMTFFSILGRYLVIDGAAFGSSLDRVMAYRVTAFAGMSTCLALFMVNHSIRPASAFTDALLIFAGDVERRDDRLGSAHFTDRHEYKRFRVEKDHGLTLYGEFRGEEHRPGRYKILGDTFSLSAEDAARGVITIGNPGAGKSQSVILPVIADTMREQDSLIVVDPQGELKHEVMEYARVTGHIVIIHDPTDDTAARYNIAAGVNSVTLATSIGTVITGTIGEGYFENAALSLLAGCLMRYESMGEVFQAIADPQTLVRELQEPGDDASFLTADFCHALQSGASQQAAGVISTLSQKINAWADSNVRESTATCDFSAAMLMQRSVAVVLTVPGKQKESLAPYLGACVTRLLLELDTIGEQAGGALPKPVKFVIDEFPAMGNLEIIVEQANLVRKRRISFVLAAQTTGQLRRIYGAEGASTLMAGMATNIVFGGADKDTAQHYAQYVGNRTLEVDDETEREIQQPLLEASDIVSPPHAPQGNAIIFSRYVEASYAVNAVILARLTRMYERDDWARAIQKANRQGRRPRLYTRQIAQRKSASRRAKKDEHKTAAALSGGNGSGRPAGVAVTVTADGHPAKTEDTEQHNQYHEDTAENDSAPADDSRLDGESETEIGGVQPIDEMLNLTPSSEGDEAQSEENNQTKASESADRTTQSAAALADQLDVKEDKRVMEIRPNERWHIDTERTSP